MTKIIRKLNINDELTPKEDDNLRKEDIATKKADVFRLPGLIVNGEKPDNPVNIPYNIGDNHSSQIVNFAPKFLNECSINEDYVVSNKNNDCEYQFFSPHLELTQLLVTFRNPTYTHSANINDTVTVPGSISFLLEWKKNQQNYKLIDIFASSIVLHEMKSFQKKIDFKGDEFEKLTNLWHEIDIARQNLLEAIYKAKINLLAATYKTQSLPIKSAEKMLIHCERMSSKYPERNDSLIELLNLTTDYIDPEKESPSIANYQPVVDKLTGFNSDILLPLSGTIMVILGSTLILGAALTTGPAGIGLFGLDIALKLLKIYMVSHAAYATASFGALAAGASITGFDALYHVRQFFKPSESYQLEKNALEIKQESEAQEHMTKKI